MINLHSSIAELDIARKKKINAGLRDSARGYYSLECTRKKRNVRLKNETEVDRHPVDPTNKTIQSGKIKYCCSVDYENMEFQAISWKDIEEEYKEDHKLNALRQATMDNDHEQILELLKAHKIK